MRDSDRITLWLLPASQPRDRKALTDAGVGRGLASCGAAAQHRSCASPYRVFWRTERSARNEPDLLSSIREEILSVIAKHMHLDRDKVR